MIKNNSNTKYLIINADDFGMCHSANVAIMEMLRDGKITSTSIMPNCAWFEEAADFLRANTHIDVGVHLTFTSEWTALKWSPLTFGASLKNSQGYFHATCKDFQLNATESDVQAEIIAQIEKVKALGIEISNLDNHMGSLIGIESGISFMPATLAICSQYQLPYRLPKIFPKERTKLLPEQLVAQFQQLIALGESLNVNMIDHLIEYPFHKQEDDSYENFVAQFIGLLANLKPGVSEIYMHPAVESEELKAIHNSWQRRVYEYRVMYDSRVEEELKKQDIQLIGWRDLK